MLKDSEVSLSERKSAFEEFAPLLASHAKAEEEVLYVAMKKNEELREDGFEGDVEYIMADQLLEEIPRTTDEDLWSARVEMGGAYNQRYEELLSKDGVDSPAEKPKTARITPLAIHS